MEGKYSMKIVAFAQLRNELELGNLENWFKCMESFDEIYIYDQNSTDGSKEYYKKYPNVHLIESETNDFSNEVVCKSKLLAKLLEEQPDTDWIFWMDGDTILDGRLLEDEGKVMKTLLQQASEMNIDGLFLDHYNLWRSDIWHRVDDQYDHFLRVGVLAFWRNNGNLTIPLVEGLHKSQYPQGIETAARIPFGLIHRGFATDEHIIEKYERYKERGQTGWELDRLLNEKGIAVGRIPPEVFPEWLEINEEEAKEVTATRVPIKEIYESKYCNSK